MRSRPVRRFPFGVSRYAGAAASATLLPIAGRKLRHSRRCAPRHLRSAHVRPSILTRGGVAIPQSLDCPTGDWIAAEPRKREAKAPGHTRRIVPLVIRLSGTPYGKSRCYRSRGNREVVSKRSSLSHEGWRSGYADTFTPTGWCLRHFAFGPETWEWHSLNTGQHRLGAVAPAVRR
jgi:hypothetical protein